MIESVHIPIFCDNESKKAGALLTLKTIRVGFPKSQISVHMMRNDQWFYDVLLKLLDLDNIAIIPSIYETSAEPETNDSLIKRLVLTKEKSFAVVDSDVVFFENCEDFIPRSIIAGEFIPEFVCPISKSVTRSRLHTAFLVVSDPVKLRREIELVYRPLLPQFCPFNPFSPVVTFDSRMPYFHDSCSVLYHAIGGDHFAPDMLRRFEHLYGGSYMTGEHRKRIDAAYKNPESVKGTREMMTRYFEERKP